MTIFTETWNAGYEALPPDSEDALQGASRIRFFKLAVRERLAVDHSWAGDALDGKHLRLTLPASAGNPTLDAGDGALYTKVSGGVTEIFYKDSAGNITQLTSAGNAGFPGEVRDYFGLTEPGGWLFLNGKTIGSAASAATGRANADTLGLYTILWNACADAQCPVSTGRGANAAADFGVNKTLTLPDARGRLLAGKDDMGGVSANRLTNPGTTIGGINGDILGNTGGQETHTDTASEMPTHIHTFSGLVAFGPGPTSGYAGGSGPISAVPVTSAGGDGAHNNVQPTLICNKIIKL